MKAPIRCLTVAMLAALSSSAHADIMIDVINGSEVTLQGLFQADTNYFDNDVVDLNGSDTNDGKNRESELRRAEVILIGKGVEESGWNHVTKVMMAAIVLLFVLSGFFRGFDMKLIESFHLGVPLWLENVHNLLSGK